MAVHLLRNPVSGRGSRSKAADQHRLDPLVAGREVIDLTGTSAEASSQALSSALSNGEIEQLVIAGGDGLVHLAIQQLAQTDIPVVIVPTGTGNDFAAGVDHLITSNGTDGLSEVDLLLVSTVDGTQCWVASIAIAGFPAAINKRANTLSLPLGPALYTVAAIAELPGYTRTVIDYELTGGLEPVRRATDTGMLAIGNTRFFGGGMLACPDARANDGLLHLTSIEGVGRIGILRHIQHQKGGTADWDEVERATGTSVTLHTPDVELWGDGEYLGLTPATIEVIPAALVVKSQ